MITLYKILMSISTALVKPFVNSKIKKNDLFWSGRFGYSKNKIDADIWMHAASVGETRVLSFLISSLLKKQPDLKIHVTVMTKAGFDTAMKIFTENVSCSFFPFDSPKIIERTFDKISPRMLVIAETEIWPCLITEADKRTLPVICVNGRMSEKAANRYNWIKASTKIILSKYDRFFLKSNEDAQRYENFGLTKQDYEIVSDMKFDAPLLKLSEGRKMELRWRAGTKEDNFLLVAGSTRPGEEVIILDIFKKLKKNGHSIKIILAPRHIDRVDEIAILCQEREIKYSIYGEQAQYSDISIVNKIGILSELYGAGDLAFVGGTLAPIGGHNLLEPVWAGTPLLFGNSIENVRDSADYIIDNNYGKKVNSPEELYESIVEFDRNRNLFNIRREQNIENSPATIVSDYILKRFKNA